MSPAALLSSLCDMEHKESLVLDLLKLLHVNQDRRT